MAIPDIGGRQSVGTGGTVGRRRINPVGYILILPAFIMWLIFNTWPVI